MSSQESLDSQSQEPLNFQSEDSPDFLFQENILSQENFVSQEASQETEQQPPPAPEPQLVDDPEQLFTATVTNAIIFADRMIPLGQDDTSMIALGHLHNLNQAIILIIPRTSKHNSS